MSWFSMPKIAPKKSGSSKRLDKKVGKALNASSGKCVQCKKNGRSGEALFCKTCIKKMWSF